MATQIIVLESQNDGNDIIIRGVNWFYPPVANQQYFTKAAGTKSAFVRATAQNNTDIVNGVIVEEEFEFRVPNSWTQAAIKAELVSRYNARQSALSAGLNKFTYTGLSYDGATTLWSNL